MHEGEEKQDSNTILETHGLIPRRFEGKFANYEILDEPNGGHTLDIQPKVKTIKINTEVTLTGLWGKDPFRFTPGDAMRFAEEITHACYVMHHVISMKALMSEAKKE